MDSQTKQLWSDIQSGEFDINNQELFFTTLIRGFVYDINKSIKVRNKLIPHYILNTGDDIMYLEIKGQDHSKEPLETVNEDFVYSQIPRCILQPEGMNIPTDQLTSPYSYGVFHVEWDDIIYAFRAEFRRIPINFTVSLKYYFDNFTDALATTQQIITKLSFINTFSIVYLGQTIPCSYKIPDDFTTEKMIEFDGLTTDNRSRTLSLELSIESNLPVIYSDTTVPSDLFIRQASPSISQFEEITDVHQNTTFEGSIDSVWNDDRVISSNNSVGLFSRGSIVKKDADEEAYQDTGSGGTTPGSLTPSEESGENFTETRKTSEIVLNTKIDFKNNKN